MPGSTCCCPFSGSVLLLPPPRLHLQPLALLWEVRPLASLCESTRRPLHRCRRYNYLLVGALAQNRAWKVLRPQSSLPLEGIIITQSKKGQE